MRPDERTELSRGMNSASVVQGDVVAVGVGEGEGAAEGAVDRGGDDGVAVGGEVVVDGLDVGGVQPDRRADAGTGGGGEVGAGDDVAQGEGEGLRLEDDGVRGPAGDRARPRYCS